MKKGLSKSDCLPGGLFARKKNSAAKTRSAYNFIHKKNGPAAEKAVLLFPLPVYIYKLTPGLPIRRAPFFL